jgi:phenylalanyl-tRNA synthetase alpha chain
MIDQKLAEGLKRRAQEGDTSVLRSPELRALFDELKTLPQEERSSFGQAVNGLQAELRKLLADKQDQAEQLPPIDITAPFDVNVPAGKRPGLLPTETGSRHPLMT